MTNEEQLQEREREEEKLKEIRKKIPRERYEWESKASPAERHRRRAEEVSNEDLRQLHLDHAKQQEEQELLYAQQVRELEEQVARNQEEDNDRLFQIALKQGPTRLTRLGWRMADIGTAIDGNIITPVLGVLGKLGQPLFVISWLCTAALLAYFCFRFGLGFHLVAGLILMIVLVIVDIMTKSKKMFWALSIIVMTFLAATVFWKVFTPDPKYWGVHTRNGKVVQVVQGQPFMASPIVWNNTDQVYWYFSGGEWQAYDGDGRNGRKTTVNGQNGILTAVVHTQLKAEVLEKPALPRSPQDYRGDLTYQFRVIWREIKAKGANGEQVKLEDYQSRFLQASNDAYKVVDATITFIPDPFLQTPPPIVIK